MAIKIQHNKIKQLKQRAKPITYSMTYVDQNGVLQNLDFKPVTEQESRAIKGYLCVWGVRDTHGTVFVKGCFAKSIAERGPKSSAKQKILFLWMHDTCDPIGQFDVLEEDDYGLYFEATVDNVENGERALIQTQSGTLNQFSVGFDYVWDKMEYDETRDAILIMEAILMEGSVVSFASNDQTYCIRSQEDFEMENSRLQNDTELFIRSIPKNLQLELRRLITRHKTLAEFKPDKPLEQRKPDNEDAVEIGGYKLNVKQFIK